MRAASARHKWDGELHNFSASLGASSPMPVPDLSLPTATLAALVVETFNIGAFTILFGGCLSFIFTKRMSDVNGVLTPTLCLIWILSIVHWVVDIIRARIAFIDDPANAVQYLTDPTVPLDGAKLGLYASITIVADFFMLYRCWMVWNHNVYALSFPVLCWLATASTGWVGTAEIIRTQRGGIFIPNLQPWIISFFSLSLATNVLCTLLIAYKVLLSQIYLRRTGTHSTGRVIPALIIFLESAALYSLSLIALLVLYQTGLSISFIILDWTCSVIGIAFSIIIIRLSIINSRLRSAQSTTAASLPPLHTPSSGNYPLVRVSRLVTRDDWSHRHYSESGSGAEEDRLDRKTSDTDV
ncbi:hypothetical protein MIND_00660900 [Mycena indigotica]|uniref:Uncharacterized protein n=1 Tax=Mycena indigotica TaxID=2126181 RepID=A0A8H6W433_9AGAR|nr:uncharacterized protein MIND_00660900 [Mycena indigotica]KAF7300978.1 hypothetical protein MIND_00660900 [Mycena indigotica]